MEETETKRRIRFGLRTLLTFIGIAALLCWAYWIGWPRWTLHLQEARFVESVKNVKAGMTAPQIRRAMPDMPFFASNYLFDENPLRAKTLWAFVFRDRIYCIFLVLDEEVNVDGIRNHRLDKVELFDLALPSAEYGDQSIFATVPIPIYQQSRDTDPRVTLGADEPYWSYLGNFAYFLHGDRKHNLGFQYELIYSDPPTNSMQ